MGITPDPKELMYSNSEQILGWILRELQSGGAGGAGLATEATLQSVLQSIQDGQDYEAKLVVDDDGNGDTYLEVRIWNPDTQTWETPLYYAAGSNTGVPAGSLTAPIIYINPNQLLAQIANNTNGLATEATLIAFSAKFNTLGRKISAESHPVVLSDEQELLLQNIATSVAALDTSNLATEVTLGSAVTLLNQIDVLLASIETNTDALDVDLSTRASEATLVLVNTAVTNLFNLLNTPGTTVVTEDTTPGNAGTIAANWKGYSIQFYGSGGTFEGIEVEDGHIEYDSVAGGATNALDYEVPTSGSILGLGPRVLIKRRG